MRIASAGVLAMAEKRRRIGWPPSPEASRSGWWAGLGSVRPTARRAQRGCGRWWISDHRTCVDAVGAALHRAVDKRTAPVFPVRCLSPNRKFRLDAFVKRPEEHRCVGGFARAVAPQAPPPAFGKTTVGSKWTTRAKILIDGRLVRAPYGGGTSLRTLPIEAVAAASGT